MQKELKGAVNVMTKPQLTAKLDEWAKKKKRVDRINAEADARLEPLLKVYEAKAEPINAARDEKLASLLTEMETLEQEIRAAMLAAVNLDGTSSLPQAESGNAVAQLNTERRREIDTAAFMRAVPPRLRLDPAYIGCLSVLVGKADKFLPSPMLARLVRPKLTHSVTLTLKSE
ncbi:MAG: hypothetical protein ABJB61_15170 [bacterium]